MVAVIGCLWLYYVCRSSEAQRHCKFSDFLSKRNVFHGYKKVDGCAFSAFLAVAGTAIGCNVKNIVDLLRVSVETVNKCFQIVAG